METTKKNLRVSAELKEKIKILANLIPKRKGICWHKDIVNRLSAKQIVKTENRVRNVVAALIWDEEIVNELIAYVLELGNSQKDAAARIDEILTGRYAATSEPQS